jgi:hypothetical protein
MEELGYLESRLLEIEENLPSIINTDYSRYVSLLKEYNILKDIVEKGKVIVKISNDLDSLKDWYVSTNDEVEKQNIEAEIHQNERRIQTARQTLQHAKKALPRNEIEPIKQQSTQQEDISERKFRRGTKDYHTSIRKVKGKVWDIIKTKWVESLATPFLPGQPPNFEESIATLPEFSSISKEIIHLEETTPHEHSLNVLFERQINVISREYTLREALFSFHKASHIIGAGEFHADNCIKSWALSSCYQGAFLAARSIINLLGVSTVSFQNNEYLVDVWNDANVADNKISAGIIRFSYQIQHRHIWALFKRLINSCTVELWNERYIQAINTIDIENFSKQRNVLNYWDHAWIFDDLHRFEYDSTFGIYPQGLEYGISYFNVQSDFSLALAQVILRMSFQLIKDLAQNTNLLRAEFDLLKAFISNQDRHPIYTRNFLHV